MGSGLGATDRSEGSERWSSTLLGFIFNSKKIEYPQWCRELLHTLLSDTQHTCTAPTGCYCSSYLNAAVELTHNNWHTITLLLLCLTEHQQRTTGRQLKVFPITFIIQRSKWGSTRTFNWSKMNDKRDKNHHWLEMKTNGAVMLQTHTCDTCNCTCLLTNSLMLTITKHKQKVVFFVAFIVIRKVEPGREFREEKYEDMQQRDDGFKPKESKLSELHLTDISRPV